MIKTWWDKAIHADRRPKLALRSGVLIALRQFFHERDYIEVDTPIMQVSPGLDRHVRPISINLCEPFDEFPKGRYLHTSPEFAMKKLLAAGEKKIFQIAHVFRNGESSVLHQPEFTLLEWYRADANYAELMDDIESLLSCVMAATGVSSLTNGHQVADNSWTRMTVADAFKKFAGIDLLATIGDGFDPSGSKLITAAQTKGVSCPDTSSWEDAFHHVLLERIEPRLNERGNVFLCDYPVIVGALAQRKNEDSRLAERVEAYVCGVELANGFSELTEPIEQRRRFERDITAFKAVYGAPPPIDEDFLAALEHVPPAAGMALGVDRLVMLLAGASDIRDVQWAPMDLSEQK